MPMTPEIDQALETALSEASLTDLYVAQDAVTRWGCVPGSVADKMRRVVQLMIQSEIDAASEVG